PHANQAEIDASAKEQDLVRRYRKELVNGDQSRKDYAEKQRSFDKKELSRFKARAARDAQCLNEDSEFPLPLGIQPSQDCLDRVEANKDTVPNQESTVLGSRANVNDFDRLKKFDYLDSTLYKAQTDHGRITANETRKTSQIDRKYAIIQARNNLTISQ